MASKVERHPACGCCLITYRLKASGVNMMRGSRWRLGLSRSIFRAPLQVASRMTTRSDLDERAPRSAENESFGAPALTASDRLRAVLPG